TGWPVGVGLDWVAGCAAGTPTARITTLGHDRHHGSSLPAARPVRRPRGSQRSGIRPTSVKLWRAARPVRRPRGSQPVGRPGAGDVLELRGRYADREDHNKPSLNGGSTYLSSCAAGTPT